MNLELWTDGSCNNNSKHENHGIGGWSFLIIEDGRIVYEDLGYKQKQTSSRMEQWAVIKGLEKIAELYSEDKIKVLVRSDSSYVVNCFLERWYMRWIETEWYGIKNEDLWKKMLKIYNHKRLRVAFKHVKGHAGIEHNERADYLAGEARNCLIELLQG